MYGHEFGCHRPFDEIIDDYFDDVFDSPKGMTRAFGTLSSYLKKFYYPLDGRESKKEVKKAIKDPSAVKCDFPHFVSTLHNTFRELGLCDKKK